ncbi:acetylxylan esterase [Halalkalibaculum sp. DA3122]|uniref:alpha/beta hydrolase family protein n=1 Tax=Halalkalibaculum sp. DA3122 TaxID=3373607 RepID=UPI0037542A5A
MTQFRWIALLICLCSFQIAQGQETNYDESNVPDYTLPDLFTTSEGTLAETTNEWEFNRRVEIIELFEEHVYGQVPDHFDSIEFSTVSSNPEALNGSVTARQVQITVGRKGKSIRIGLNLLIPNDVQSPVPVTVLINHRGPENMDIARQVKKDFWPAEYIVKQGYAAAVFDVEDLSDDNPETYDEDLLKTLYPEQLEKKSGMRTISAWAWGAMRVMDYIVRAPELDQERSVLVGHSRGGKTALWAGAQDFRWAVTVSNESGAGGAALSRRRFGETVQRINSGFPYWFTPNFNTYNDNESALPVDQHMLIALIAPRAVYVASAQEDQWADPRGEYLSLFHGSRVYQQIYGIPIFLPPELPDENTPVHTSHAGYHIRKGEHDLTLYDWQQFLHFSNHYFGLE